MFFSAAHGKKLIAPATGFVTLAALLVSLVPAAAASPAAAAPEPGSRTVVEQGRGNLGVIRGMVRDEQGNPIADAVVAIYKAGAEKILKEVRSAADGSFIAKILPGTYKVLAVAEGFNPTVISDVQVNRSVELNYGFKLERAGSGNTLPEKRADRYSSKSRIRAAQSRRSIYQIDEGSAPVDETAQAGVEAEETVILSEEEEITRRRGQSVVETYFAGSADGESYQGFNFATLRPLGENSEIIIAAQTGTKSYAPNRFETALKMRLNDNHQIRVATSAARVGKIKDSEKTLGQISLQALDEWRMENGVILVVGFDYSRFVGAGNDFSVSPRFGVQFDANSKTRLRAAYTTQNEERSWSRALELEDSTVFFREPLADPSAVAVDDNEKPLMNKSRRLEFGVERVLDNDSSLEATAFFDGVSGRGISLVNLPVEILNAEDFAPFTVEQRGAARGVRFVYTRRFGSVFSASAGYSFGRGQRLSSEFVANPSEVFENGFFQTFVGQLNTDLKTGMRIKTIFRFSPEAAVFAIDPFQGRLAIYDPSLSILITQPLPNWGLPIRAEAVIDARNILDSQTGVAGEQGGLQLNSQRRILRGGISVRF